MQDFKDQVAVITGGASGIGLAIARALAEHGAKLVIADADRPALDAAGESFSAKGTEHLAQLCDVSREASCRELADAAFERFGGVHMVFANAGVAAGEAGAMWGYNTSDWRWCLDVNLWGVLNCINAFMPKLVEQNAPARFVITGSGNGGMVVLQDTPIYTATKAAVQTVGENLFFQLQAMDSPVTAHMLFPGPHVVETGLFNSDRVRPAQFQKPSGEAKASGISSVDDMKRMAAEMGIELQTTQPGEVADMALRQLARGRFWLAGEHTPENRQRLQARYEMLSQLSDPAPETAYSE